MTCSLTCPSTCLGLRASGLLLAVLVVLSACVARESYPEEMTALARVTLSDLQVASTREDLEYCGSIARRASGALYATVPVAGEAARCPVVPLYVYPGYQLGDVLVATYHSHSAATLYGGSELPSYQDMTVQESLGVPGYLITPGGRFWFMDASGSRAVQICGLRCLPSDPNFKLTLANLSVPETLTREELRAFLP